MSWIISHAISAVKSETPQARTVARIPCVKLGDGFALWSRVETRYLRRPPPLQHNLFRETRTPFVQVDEDLR
jgi:hypothetical protein